MGNQGGREYRQKTPTELNHRPRWGHNGTVQLLNERIGEPVKQLTVCQDS
jgi:hypothetical protein